MRSITVDILQIDILKVYKSCTEMAKTRSNNNFLKVGATLLKKVGTAIPYNSLRRF